MAAEDSVVTPPGIKTSDIGLNDQGISVHKNTLNRWYQLMHLGRLIDTKAENYVKQGKGWSYHSSFVGHDGIQLILGLSFRQGKDFLFPDCRGDYHERHLQGGGCVVRRPAYEQPHWKAVDQDSERLFGDRQSCSARHRRGPGHPPV
jgi:hypothetical protein